MRPASLLLATGLLLLTLTPARTARAEGEPGAKQKERAFHLVKAGLALQEEGKHDLALEALTEAAEIFEHPKILFYKARSLTAQEHWQAGYDLWDRLMGHEALKEDQLVEVRDGWVRCKAALREAPAATTAAIAPVAAPVDVPTPAPIAAPAPSPVEAPVDLRAPSDMAPSDGPGVLVWSLVGGGGALTAGGAALLIQWGVQKSREEDGKHLEGEGAALALGGTLSGLGLAALGTGLYFLLADREDSAALLLPIGADGLALTWGLRF
jgi:hypothetical protein